ncbi:MAG: YdeI/OmpD-associated family protein [Myxococcales bacterium]|nr:YdeI/OmpD-associated family protein [Myxococcales bacterium]
MEPTPADLAEAIAERPAAAARWAALPPSHRREHVRYVDEAKKPETRARRIAKTVDSLTTT